MGVIDDWRGRGDDHTLSGHRIFVADIPADHERAAPILVLHGFPTSGIDWHQVVDALAAPGRRVVVPDLLGYGFSDKPDQRYSLFEQADIVDALAKDFAFDDV